MISNEVMTLRVVTAMVFLRPQWFFYVPPILVSNEVWRDGTSINLISEPLKVSPFADVIQYKGSRHLLLSYFKSVGPARDRTRDLPHNRLVLNQLS